METTPEHRYHFRFKSQACLTMRKSNLPINRHKHSTWKEKNSTWLYLIPKQVRKYENLKNMKINPTQFWKYTTKSPKAKLIPQRKREIAKEKRESIKRSNTILHTKKIWSIDQNIKTKAWFSSLPVKDVWERTEKEREKSFDQSNLGNRLVCL